ncbi:MAG TPA: cytochrome b/b6 domain-containing protein [Steroidobacteraceae bacterium]|nr:cytochrome b/b6 domain-containing protein [Steroidobacteraceae bacterium]
MTIPALRATVDESTVPRLVWDLPLRVSHWGLALSVSGAFVTDWIGPAAFGVHVVCGSVALVLVLFRIAWGFVGPVHARFGDFVRGPRAVLASVSMLRRATFRRSVGHTPLGGWMALALLALVGTQASLGLCSNDEILHTGPLYGYVDPHLSNRLSAWHGRIANLILGAVALHVAAALYYRYALGEDLVRPLVTGYKRGVGAADAIEQQRTLLAAALLALMAALVVGLIATAPEAVLAD